MKKPVKVRRKEKWVCVMPSGLAAVPDIRETIDAKAAEMAKLPQVDCPLTHSWIPGFYCRTIFMPAGTKIISKRHAKRHTYHVTKGRFAVFVEGEGQAAIICAPFCGVTEAGTRRLLEIFEDTTFTTFHPNPTNERDLKKLEAFLIIPPEPKAPLAGPSNLTLPRHD